MGVGRHRHVSAAGITVQRLVCLAATFAALAASTTIARAAGVSVSDLADALRGEPVQAVSRPPTPISAHDVRALRAQIAKLDPGRLWIYVGESLDQQRTSDLANALSGQLNADGGGTVVVVAGQSVWGTTSWQDEGALTGRLRAAFRSGRAPLAVSLRRVIMSLARDDTAAGHPKLNSQPSQTPPANTPGVASPRSSTSSGESSGSGGLVALLVALAVVVLVVVLGNIGRIRRARRLSHRRKQERADALADAQAEFTKLGEEIQALDIDSSMPQASAPGKDAYASAIECYEDAERRLAKADDDYEFEKACKAVKQGREHVHTAERLFNPPAAQT